MAYPFAPIEKEKASGIKCYNENDVDKNKGVKRQTHDDRKVIRKNTDNKTLQS